MHPTHCRLYEVGNKAGETPGRVGPLGGGTAMGKVDKTEAELVEITPEIAKALATYLEQVYQPGHQCLMEEAERLIGDIPDPNLNEEDRTDWTGK